MLRRNLVISVRNNPTNPPAADLKSTLSAGFVRFIACIFGIVMCAILTSASPVIVQKNEYVLPGNNKHIKTDAVTKSDFKFVAITIDDTPDAVYTHKMLQVLLDHGARATFFVNGPRVKAFPETARMMVTAGHEIANHTWNHYLLTKLTATQIESELTRTNDIVKTVCGVTPRFFRPPYGEFNSTVTKTALNVGLIPLLWSIDTRDWSKPGVAKIRSTVSSQLHNGAVILMHGTNEQSPAALDLILTDLEGKGYKTVTVSEWFQLVGGSDGYVFEEPEMTKELIDKLYDRDIVTSPEGEEIEILVPKRNDSGMKLADLVMSNSDTTLSIFSNLKLVEGEDLPQGLTLTDSIPPNFLKPPHNTVELRPDGKTYGFALTDGVQIEYDELYYPRPRLVMAIDDAELTKFTLDELTRTFTDCRFDDLVVLCAPDASRTPEAQVMIDGLSVLKPVSVVNTTNFPVFTIALDDTLVRTYIDLLRQKRGVVTVKLTRNLDDGASLSPVTAPTEFKRFREITGKYTFDPADGLRKRWNLPRDVEIGRYTGYNIIVITLFSRTSDLFTLAAQADDSHLEIMSFDDAGNASYQKISAGMKIEISSTPKYIVYRWGEGAEATHEASG